MSFVIASMHADEFASKRCSTGTHVVLNTSKDNYLVVLMGYGVYTAWYDHDASHLSDQLILEDQEEGDVLGIPLALHKECSELIDWATKAIISHVASNK
mgnify:CR=1 FL=1